MSSRRQTLFTECPACLGESLGPNIICVRCGGAGKVSYAILPMRRRPTRRQVEFTVWIIAAVVIVVSIAVILS